MDNFLQLSNHSNNRISANCIVYPGSGQFSGDNERIKLHPYCSGSSGKCGTCGKKHGLTTLLILNKIKIVFFCINNKDSILQIVYLLTLLYDITETSFFFNIKLLTFYYFQLYIVLYELQKKVD